MPGFFPMQKGMSKFLEMCVLWIPYRFRPWSLFPGGVLLPAFTVATFIADTAAGEASKRDTSTTRGTDWPRGAQSWYASGSKIEGVQRYNNFRWSKGGLCRSMMETSPNELTFCQRDTHPCMRLKWAQISTTLDGAKCQQISLQGTTLQYWKSNCSDGRLIPDKRKSNILASQAVVGTWIIPLKRGGERATTMDACIAVEAAQQTKRVLW